MSVINSILYISSICLFIFYIIGKYKKRAYIFSTFNIGVYIYTFDLIIAPLFFVVNESWIGLGVLSAASMRKYLNSAMFINNIGYLILIMTLMVTEFYGKKPLRILKFGTKIGNSINGQVLKLFFGVLVIFWYLICIVYSHGLPLLNGNRTFYLNSGISPIYLALNEILLMCTLYYGIRFELRGDNLINLLVGVITIAMQGNRAALLMNLILPILIVYFYIRNSKKNIDVRSAESSKRSKRRISRKIFLLIPIIAVLGVALQFVRAGSNATLSNIIFEFFYGNTFSDYRDGAYILQGFIEHTHSKFLFGKTYLSALISFIPSSMSKFRTIWSWGRYTTVNLFGMSNHFGLRGGNALEAYINFGMVGVIIFSFLQGFIMGNLEKVFYHTFIVEDTKFTGKEYFVYYVINLFYGTLVSSSGAYNIYILVLFVIGMIVCTNLVKR